MLNHLGHDLDVRVQANVWCNHHGIKTGADYLKYWIASLIRSPERPLPYLFLYSDAPCTGKSTFYRAISTLLAEPGLRIERLLTSVWTYELRDKILCCIDTLDFTKSKLARESINRLVTLPEVVLRQQCREDLTVPNVLHFIQCGTNINHAPHLPDVVCVETQALVHIESPTHLGGHLCREAPGFLNHLLNIDLTGYHGRLSLPALTQSEIE